MKYIDLHVHSTASDGSFTPEEVVKLAIERDLSAFALTDHDTLAGIKRANVAAKNATENGHPVEVIPGIEISAYYDGRDIHILGLFVDPENEILNKALYNAQIERENRNKKMAENLKSAGMDITIEKMRESEGNGVLTRAHFAKYMVKMGYVKTYEDAFKQYLHSKSPYYVPREYFKPEKAIKLIHKAGGLAVLAHPLLYNYSLKDTEKLISYLADLNLDGLEAIYSMNTGLDEKNLKKLAHKYDLVITGGSDFHGSPKPSIKIGVGKGNLRIPYSLLEPIENRLEVIRKN